MDFIKMAKDRFSTRRFSDKEVSKEIESLIIETARVAPTSHNSQGFRLYVIHSDKRDEVFEGAVVHNFKAPLNIVVVADYEETFKRPIDGFDFAETDAAIVATHIMFAAESLGLQSCWVCNFDPIKLGKNLNLSEHEKALNIMEIGYIAEKGTPSLLHQKRKTIEEILVRVK